MALDRTDRGHRPGYAVSDTVGMDRSPLETFLEEISRFTLGGYAMRQFCLKIGSIALQEFRIKWPILDRIFTMDQDGGVVRISDIRSVSSAQFCGLSPDNFSLGALATHP